jgi:hypothetical protein
MVKKFFGMPFWQSFVAGLLCFVFVSGVVFVAFKKSIIGIYKLSKIIMESQIITIKDGTKIYDWQGYSIIERKDGSIEIIPNRSLKSIPK